MPFNKTTEAYLMGYRDGRETVLHSTYCGASIYRNIGPGYRLRWTSLCYGSNYAADTLAGIKELIRGDRGVWCIRRPRR